MSDEKKRQHEREIAVAVEEACLSGLTADDVRRVVETVIAEGGYS